MAIKRALLVAVALSAFCSFFDPYQERAYPCDPDAGDAVQCPGGGRCGFAGVCHPIGVPGPYACNTGTDCEASWYCGVQHVCYDRLDAGAVACAQDFDCAPGWRCGPDLICADSAAERLLPATAIGSLQISRLNPAYSGMPTLTAASPWVGATTFFASFALADDQGLRFTAQQNGFFSAPFVVARLDAEQAATSLAAIDSRVYFADPTGTHRWTVGIDGGQTVATVLPAIPNAQLRVFQDPGPISVVMAFGGPRFAYVLDGADAGSPVFLFRVSQRRLKRCSISLP